jgi:hypothetical protein
VVQANVTAETSNQWFNFQSANTGATGDYGYVTSTTTGSHVVSAKLQLNGHDRFAERPAKYFNLVQPFQHHENVPASEGINVYSFALQPESHQPSGTLNMSRIDSAVLNLTVTSAAASVAGGALIKVFAVNYNVLRIMSGMGGLAYSN